MVFEFWKKIYLNQVTAQNVRAHVIVHHERKKKQGDKKVGVNRMEGGGVVELTSSHID